MKAFLLLAFSVSSLLATAHAGGNGPGNSTISQKSLHEEFTCIVGDYVVEISPNVNENTRSPLSIVRVFKNKTQIYNQFYKLSYEKSGNLEVWSYEGFRHADGVIGVAATSANTAKADIFIEIGAKYVVDGASVDCSR